LYADLCVEKFQAAGRDVNSNSRWIMLWLVLLVLPIPWLGAWVELYACLCAR